MRYCSAKLDAAIVDNASFTNLRRHHPGRFARLKVLAQSELFPASVVAHYQGVISDKTLAQVRDGMLRANTHR